MAEATKAGAGTLKFPKKEDVNDNIPSKETIAKIANFPVLDSNVKEVPFRVLYGDGDGGKKDHKTLVIFTRNFFNPTCQDIIEHTCKGLPSPAELQALPTPVSIATIVCGAHTLIPFYAKNTSCPFPIYAEPTLYLYSVL